MSILPGNEADWENYKTECARLGLVPLSVSDKIMPTDYTEDEDELAERAAWQRWVIHLARQSLEFDADAEARSEQLSKELGPRRIGWEMEKDAGRHRERRMTPQREQQPHPRSEHFVMVDGNVVDVRTGEIVVSIDD